jgi:hypothetical protein
MKTSPVLLLAVALMLVWAGQAEVYSQKKADNQNGVWAGPVTEWPRVIPARRKRRLFCNDPRGGEHPSCTGDI